MPVFAVVPVQLLERAKSRLAPILSAGERRDLVLTLLDNVLAALGSSSGVAGTIVVSPDPDVLRRIERGPQIAVQQPGRGLNSAIRLGRDRAVERGADAILIVLADLPRLSSDEIDRLLDLSASVAVTLAPDRHGHGTNAMILRPPGIVEPQFGLDSFHKHSDAVARLGLSSAICSLPGLAFDIDTVDDLIALGWLAGVPAQTDERAIEDSLSPAVGKVVPSHQLE